MVQRKSEHSASRSKSSSSPKTPDAFTLLADDHKKVRKLFTDFRKAGTGKESGDQKTELVNQICMELTIHAQVEEEIFYPAVRKAIDDDDLMDEANDEHDEIKRFIAQLQSSTPDDRQYDDQVSMLAETVGHHVKEEEGEVFPKAKKAKLDVAALGERIRQRKDELRAELGTAPTRHVRQKKSGKSQSTGT